MLRVWRGFHLEEPLKISKFNNFIKKLLKSPDFKGFSKVWPSISRYFMVKNIKYLKVPLYNWFMSNSRSEHREYLCSFNKLSSCHLNFPSIFGCRLRRSISKQNRGIRASAGENWNFYEQFGNVEWNLYRNFIL